MADDSGTPAVAVVAIAAAWAFFAVIVAIYSLGAIMLLPFLPVFLFGPVCLLSAAHGYAEQARDHRK